jgi:sugar fermentation stimulation protein
MKYDNVSEGVFIARPNRFIAHTEIEGVFQVAHVRNTSRCRELLTDGARIFLEKSSNPNRKTGYSLITVEKEGRLINIDSQAPNKVCLEGILSGRILLPERTGLITLIKPEKVHGGSRLDLYLESQPETGPLQRVLIEVKGVTLLENNVARFPDAPTERGLKHVNELRQAAADGYLAYIIFIIQMKGIDHFEPNDRMHPAFGAALRLAAAEGVKVLAYDCHISEDRITVADAVPVVL